MRKILFCCHGNICRSPMAELIMKKLVNDEDYEINSCALTREEIGNPIYPPIRSLLEAKGYDCSKHWATLIKESDYEYYDYIIAMDNENLYYLNRYFPGDPLNKISLLLSDKEVDDPWYTRQFQRCYEEIYAGCLALKERLERL